MSVVRFLRTVLLSALVVCLGPMPVASAAPGGGSFSSAASAPRTPIVRVYGTDFFSPDGDGTKDRARYKIAVNRRADVTVKVTTKRGRVIARDQLGRLSRGTYSWTWDGRNDRGRNVADRTYFVKTIARTVRTAKIASWSWSVFLDTVYEPRQPEVTDDTLYPNTTVVTDEIWFRNASSGEGETAKRFVLRIKDARDRLRYTETLYSKGSNAYGLGWDGRDNDGNRLPAGSYTARLRGTDNAGNTGTSDALNLTISDSPLVEATGNVTVTPAASQVEGPNYCGGNRPPNGCADAYPCGKVVASTAYLEPGALSYRSAECIAPNPDVARGYHKIDPAIDAPRGVIHARVSMRGKPTVDGDTDTAMLAQGGASVTSAAVAGESITTTPTSSMWHPQSLTSGVGWLVTTLGTDTYDVASFTVDYTYLTPRS